MSNLTNIVEGTAIMLAVNDNEEWDKLSEELQLRYLKEAIETMLKAIKEKSNEAGLDTV